MTLIFARNEKKLPVDVETNHDKDVDGYILYPRNLLDLDIGLMLKKNCCSVKE